MKRLLFIPLALFLIQGCASMGGLEGTAGPPSPPGIGQYVGNCDDYPNDFCIGDDGSLYIPGGLFVGTATHTITETASITDAQVKRAVITNHGQSAESDLTLPAISQCVDVRFERVTATVEWDILPPTGEQFNFDGTDLTADYEIQLGTAKADAMICSRIQTGASTYQWWCRTVQGTHTGQAAD